MLKTPTLSRGVPHPWQDVDLGHFAQAEAAPIFGRTVRRKHLVAPSAELIRENVWIARLCSENERTEEAQVAPVPGADAISRQHCVPDKVVIGIGTHGAWAT